MAGKSEKSTKTKKKKARQAEPGKAGSPIRRKSSNPEGLRRRARAGLHRCNAGLETGCRSPPP